MADENQNEEGKLGRDWVKGDRVTWGDRLKKGLKFLAYIVLALISIVLLWIGATEFLESKYYKKLTYEHPVSLGGFRLGDLKKDVVFKRGEPEKCEDSKGEINYIENQVMNCRWMDGFFRVRFSKGGTITRLLAPSSYFSAPIPDSLESLEFILGEPEILWISKDLKTRRLAYSQDGLQTVVSYSLNTKQDLVVKITDDVRWEYYGLGEYYIYGVKYCPGENCPFDGEGGRKKQWKDKTVRDFLKAREGKE